MRLKRGIILEGPDGTGKSTLGKRLAEYYEVAYYYGGGPPKTQEDITFCCARNRQRILEPSVQDRVTFISENVYRPIMDREFAARLPRGFMHDHLRVGMSLDPIVVYCCAEGGGERATAESYEDDAFLKRLAQCLPRIQEKYRELMTELRQSGAKVVEYDFRRHSFKDLLILIAVMDNQES